MRSHAAFPVVVAVLGAIGAAVSVLSTLDHVRFKATGGDSEGFCAAIVDSGCASAHASPAAEVLGVPISIPGTAWYLTAIGLSAWAWRSTRSRHRQPPASRGHPGALRAGNRQPVPAGTFVPAVLLAASVGGVAYSAWLASVLYRLGQLCPFCAALYAVNAGMLATSVAWAWPWLRRPLALARGAIAPAAVAAVSMSAVVAVQVAAYLASLPAPAPRPAPAGVAIADGARAMDLPDRVPSRGAPLAAATLVEFSDLECPYCETMHQTISQLVARRSDGLRVRYVHFPLDTACNCHVAVCLHRTACLAARGGICAAAEGRFWEYADACYADRTHHQRADLVAIARGIGLDPDRFDACLDAPSTASALAQDIELAHSVGVRATPTIVLNGVKFEGAIDLPRLTELLDRTEVCSCDLSTEACACDHDHTDCECGTQVVGKDSCGM